MKKIWKFALAATALAGLVPYSHKKDDETGASVTQALLWSCRKKPDGDKDIIIGLHLGSLPLPTAEEEELIDVEETPAEYEIVPVESEDLPAEPEEVSAEIL